jgi:phosphoribosyl-ATP pyrophosphohydrolase
MKKACTKRVATTAHRGLSTRIDEAFSLHSGTGKPRSIHLPAAELHSGNYPRPETAGDSLIANASVLEDLSGALAEVTATDNPRTFKLLQSGRNKLARKLIEEACEVTVEAVKRDLTGVVRESADLLYHLVVLWFQLGIEPIEVWQEMRARAAALGIAEKLPKATVSKTAANKFNR